ncbi:hypothetical protein I204_03697 [Kwoniella mangroviensis CBS 8886]|nr:uncharacterized protein I203_02841 [Kwoniella mangroviensis CBS 8507]OCF68179.1 hypothetical protein I203_02841 [Kwoniella mangroviensis CBS 8507]OCF74855.1 hypothetical protein I204_03697 [Kwoniella mangroviensis CBS 8886]
MPNLPILNEPPINNGGSSSSAPSSPRPESPNPDPSKPRRRGSHGRLAKLIAPGRSRSTSNASQVSVNQEDTHSAGSSGRTTPELRRRAGKAATTSLLASDAKYKKYAQLVDKSLQAFESVNEWADFISFLSRLLKTLQSPSPPYPEIPKKLIVSKRLAQCLNPALPAGVHQRALDVYAHIFSIIGVEGLKRDLLIWSSGLFPFFQYATTSVRPLLINIYETCYLPLGSDLRPATKALVLALLPGMEEETGDFFDKILSLLDRVSEAITPSFFLKNIFLILISSPQSRLSALNYLSRRLLKPPKPGGSAVGLVIRGVSAALGDENVLVRRHGLDLVLRILKINEPLFKDADRKDQEILVRAASGVLLQRELSLSRRVYTWLLGTGEVSAEQIAYFRGNGLELLSSTLQSDMELLGTTRDGPDAQRPFKIFLSFLDKWEVGSALSERLVIPALRAIKNATSDSKDVIGTALAVYEAIEPIIVWKLLYASVEAELDARESNGIQLVQWLISAVPQHDEEVNSVHIPVLLDLILSAIAVNASTDVFRLAAGLLHLIPLNAASRDPSTIDKPVSAGPSMSEVLYQSDEQHNVAHERINTEVLPHITTLAFDICHNALLSQSKEPESLLDAVNIVIALLDNEVPTLGIVDGENWLSGLVQALSKVSSFTVIESLVTAALKASRCSAFKPSVVITSQETMSAILDSLFRYLRPDAAAYHVRAVELLWEYNQMAEPHTLENVIARRMADIPLNSAAFDAFGILWRLTADDTMLPGEMFNIPISMVLDALRSSDPEVQRQAETWMRLNLRSYFRVLDPIISRLLDRDIRYHEDTYATPVDLSLICHQIDNISILFKFGGQGLSKACHSTEIRQTIHSTLVKRVEASFPSAATYLEVLVALLIRFITTEASQAICKAAPLIIRLQASAIELLQTIVSRGDVSYNQLTSIKTSLVIKLSSAVEHKRMTLQSKLLHLLHSAISASSASKSFNHRRSPSLNEKSHQSHTDSEFELILVKLIIEAVLSTSNLSALQHWVDFVLMTLPQLATARTGLLQALSECFAQQLRYLSIHIDSVYIRSEASVEDEKLLVTDAEVVMILNAMERVLILLSSGPGVKHDDMVKQNEGEKGLLGLMSGVFTVEAPTDDSAKTEYPRYLDDAIHALLVSWTITRWTSTSTNSSSSKIQTYDKIRSRVKRVLEKIFKTQPLGVITSCIHVWATNSNEITDSATFDCVDTLTPSAQRLVEVVCEAVAGRSGRTSSEFRADPAYLAFLEAYISRLEAPIAVQVWPTLFGFAKDIIGSLGSNSARVQLLLVLKCLTALSVIVSKTSALEDRRLRRDLQDTYAKVLDMVVTNSTKVAEAGLWTRMIAVTASPGDTEKIDVEKGLQQIYEFLSASVIPNLRLLLVDTDRVNAACSGMMVMIVTPSFKKQKVEPSVLRLLLEIIKIPSAHKTWRTQIGDIFNDSRFFKHNNEADIGYWKTLICGLMDSDKERFTDLLGKITSASSANIFSNREQEMLVKSLNLRRLSFVLLSAENNHYLVQLPAIQERLVEMLRSSQLSPRVHSEVYLCLRVLMCRISPQHLTNFWPVILTELLRIFELTMDDPPEDGSEALQLVLAACKFLDLLLVIQSEDFQVHQWMFVTDTTDAVYPTEGYDPEALMDCLSNILSDNGGHRGRSGSDKSPYEPLLLSEQSENGARKPRLSSVRTLNSIYQLQPFFSRASIDTFEGVYGGVGVDWETVEEGLSEEIFDV